MAISEKQFEQLQSRVRGARRAAAPVLAASHRPQSVHQIIAGIDPSLRGTGYGVIRLGKPHHAVLAQGTIRCPAGWERSRCLLHIATTLRDVLREHRPTVCAIEESS